MADQQRPYDPEESNALVRLMNAAYDASWMTDDELIAAAIEARETKKQAELTASVELARRDWSWRRIGKALGVDHTTCYGWVRDAGLLPLTPREDPMAATEPEKQPIANAIVTSHLGVLGGLRNEGWWAFIGGEIEPGESATDAAVREVKEETGLEVRAGHVEIGRRVHPRTGRTMIYLACTPVGPNLNAIVGDTDELAEVRWLSLADVDELMVGVFEPVRRHLGRVIS